MVLTGAGISTPSGIPDFRSSGGLWTQVDPMEVAHIDVWRTNPVRFWEFYRHRLDVPDTFAPNNAHYALTDLQRRGLLAGVITQNIDGLHQKAGLEDVIEIHGSVRTLVCPCGADFTRETALNFFAADGVPYCPQCADAGFEVALKPDVVLFGEMLPETALARAYALAYGCDLMLCIGSSLSVQPVAELPAYAAAGGAKVVVIAHVSDYDEFATLHLHGDVAVELAGVLTAVAELSR